MKGTYLLTMLASTLMGGAFAVCQNYESGTVYRSVDIVSGEPSWPFGLSLCTLVQMKCTIRVVCADTSIYGKDGTVDGRTITMPFGVDPVTAVGIKGSTGTLEPETGIIRFSNGHGLYPANLAPDSCENALWMSMSQSYMCPEANAAPLIEMADNAADTSSGSGEAEDEWTCALSRCQDRFESAGGNAIAENFNWGVNIFYTLHQLEINEPLKDAVACACTCEGTHNPSAWPIGGLVCQSFVFLSFFGR